MIDNNNKLPAKEMMAPQNKVIAEIPSFSKQEPKKPKRDIKRTIVIILGLLSFFGVGVAGVMISQKQYTDDSITAPNAPKSRPAAYVNTDGCHVSFTVPGPTIITSCGFGPCELDSDCEEGSICITADDENTYCSKPEYEETCATDPGVESCCDETEPTITPTPLECGATECETDDDCDEDLICITADDENTYCSKPEYEDACIAEPGQETCCEEPTPTATPMPSECGSTPCDTNDDCNDDLICITASDNEKYCSKPEYEDACNDSPSIDTCCEEPEATTTPTIEPTKSSSSSSSSSSSVSVKIDNKEKTTTTTKGAQPEYPEELPETGPENWIQYLQVGLGVLGIGALMILFL
jgi:hypothetical protein